MSTLRTPPPVPSSERVKVGDIAYVRVRITGQTEGALGGRESFEVQAIDSTLHPIIGGHYSHFTADELITLAEMRRLVGK